MRLRLSSSKKEVGYNVHNGPKHSLTSIVAGLTVQNLVFENISKNRTVTLQYFKLKSERSELRSIFKRKNQNYFGAKIVTNIFYFAVCFCIIFAPKILTVARFARFLVTKNKQDHDYNT